MVPVSQGPRSSLSGVARELAARLFAVELDGASDDAALIAAAERLSERIPAGLSRWFGGYGSLALVTRALAAQAAHPALSDTVDVASSPKSGPLRSRIDVSARLHDARTTADGLIAVIATLADLIARLIGDDLVVNVLELSAADPAAVISSSPPPPEGGPQPLGSAQATKRPDALDRTSPTAPPVGDAPPTVTNS
jgi:hypothetical protein